MSYKRSVEEYGDFCEDCYNTYKPHLKCLYKIEATWSCSSCREVKEVARCKIAGDLVERLFDLVHEQKKTIETLKKAANLLETHIRFAPGGEGALEALKSFKNKQ